MNTRELMSKRAGQISQARALIDTADAEQRQLTADEETRYQALMAEADRLEGEIKRRDVLEQAEDGLQRSAAPARANLTILSAEAQRKRDEVRAIAQYARTGDMAGLLDLRAASNNTDMNIGTPADGGYAVPTGHYQGIIAKRDQVSLAGPLGCMRIPGIGTTVNVPVDAGTANLFVSTNETSSFDQDAPALGQAAMTLVKYTKKVTLSDELLNDEDSKLVAFLDDYVGRAAGLTYNNLLFTEALANGTSVALTAAGVISAGDAEILVYSIKPQYADQAAFVMRRATEGKFRGITNLPFLYQPELTGNLPIRTLSGYPVYNSEAVGAVGAGNKSVAYGNWQFVGFREGPAMTFLRDPYSAAATGQVNLFYYFRVVFKVLIPEAIVYGHHPTA
jgi:HK97 family phage major capsid protein